MNRRIDIVALAIAMAALPARAQQPTASDLGSPAAAAAASADYRSLVEASLPQVSASDLAARLQAAAKEGREGLLVRDVRAWAALFDLPLDRLSPEQAKAAGNEILDLERGSLRVKPEEGRFWVALRVGETKPYPRQEYTRLVPEIRRAHAALAERIGIPKAQVHFTDFRETLTQTTPRPGLPGARESAIESIGATTTLLRAVGGILVDASFVRIVSVDPQRVEMVDVRWPEIVFAPGIEFDKIQAPRALAARLVERVTEAAQKRPVQVLMAVVLRPLRAPYRTWFVPSLRVGVVPKSERLADGYRTDAGEVLYVDLVPGFEERDRKEVAPESLERKKAAAPR